MCYVIFSFYILAKSYIGDYKRQLSKDWEILSPIRNDQIKVDRI